MITLAVDAMGGDAGLAVTIPGALLFLRQQADVRLLMVGDEVQGVGDEGGGYGLNRAQENPDR